MACPEAARRAVSLLLHRLAAPDTPAPGAKCFSTAARPVLEAHVHLVANLLIGGLGDADAAWLCDAFQTCGNIDTVTEQILALDHYIANIDSDPEFDSFFGWDIRILTIHSALHIQGTAHSVHDRKKFDENPVAGGFHDTAAMVRNGGINQLASKVSQALERALLIKPSQSRITRHIGGEDRGKLSRCAHCSNARRLETTF